jgi:hypothetical protein
MLDLTKALNSLSLMAQKYSNEELLEAKKVFTEFESSLDKLNEMYQDFDGKNPSLMLELLKQYEKIREEILRKF